MGLTKDLSNKLDEMKRIVMRRSKHQKYIELNEELHLKL